MYEGKIKEDHHRCGSDEEVYEAVYMDMSTLPGSGAREL